MSNNILGKITEGFSESTNSAREISKENFTYVKDESKAYRDEVTAPHPGMEGFKEAEGFGGKARAVMAGMKDEMNRQKETMTQFQDDAIHLRGTSDVLRAQRGFTEAIINATVPGRRQSDSHIISSSIAVVDFQGINPANVPT